MEIGINVESLGVYIKNNEKNNQNYKNNIKMDTLKSKIVEYSFFIQNEIEVSHIIDKSIQYHNKYGFFRYLTVQKYDIIKLCETNKTYQENLINKKYLVLKYKNIKKNDNNRHYGFIDSFINEENNLPILCKLLYIYECILKNITFLFNNSIRLIDFSSKNLLYDVNDSCIYMKNFKKCYKNSILSDFYDNYSSRNQNINEFIQILENTEYFGNKHFDLFFAKQIIIRKDLLIILNNLDIIIENYINNLYFFRFFPEKVKNEYIILCKKYIKSNPIFEKNQINPDIISTNDWRLFLCLFLKKSHSNSNSWETFSINSLFLNISISLLKFFTVEEKNTILHKYIKFLFSNLDITKQIDVEKNENNYYYFMNSFENSDHEYNSTILSNLSIEKQEELCDYLINNMSLF